MNLSNHQHHAAAAAAAQAPLRRGRFVFLVLVGILVALQGFSWRLTASSTNSVLSYVSLSSSTDAMTTTMTTATQKPSLLLSSSSSSSTIACRDDKKDDKSQHHQQQRIHMVVVADAKFSQRYKPIFDRMQAYATRHNYTWTVLGREYFARQNTPTPCDIHVARPGHFFFLKHCLVACWMEAQQQQQELVLAPNDAVFVFDADVVPYRMDVSLEHWADSFQESIVLYSRGWRDNTNEITAGNYLVRNTVAARDFLRAWALYEFVQPTTGFSSYDNGAIHLHLLRTLGFEAWYPPGKCGTLYQNLRSPVTNLTAYWNFVACTRKLLISTPKQQTYARGDFTFRLLPKWTSWVEDYYIDTAPTHKVPGPVFHHGVKIDPKGNINKPNAAARYNLTLV